MACMFYFVRCINITFNSLLALNMMFIQLAKWNSFVIHILYYYYIAQTLSSVSCVVQWYAAVDMSVRRSVASKTKPLLWVIMLIILIISLPRLRATVIRTNATGRWWRYRSVTCPWRSPLSTSSLVTCCKPHLDVADTASG